MVKDGHTLHLDIMKGDDGALCPRKLEQIRSLTGATCFIETGTYLGNTTHAMRSIFDQVVSIELSSELYLTALARFKSDDKVKLIHGNSAEKIGEALAYAGRARPLVWLDAHWSGGNTAKADGNTPILAEIRSIKDAGVTDAVILIDDISYFWDVHPGFNVHDSIGGYPEVDLLIAELKSLNPDFTIFVNGDIMFAIPSSLMSGAEISPALDATSRLRTGIYGPEELPTLEATVAGAEGSEEDVLLQLPEVYSHALSYGVGGYFCYWRGLIHEKHGRNDEAKRDFDIARDCGVKVAIRGWEN